MVVNVQVPKTSLNRSRTARLARAMHRTLIGILIGCASATLADESSMMSVDTIVANMTAARAQNREHFRAYQITREYTLTGKDKQTPNSVVVATLSFVPPNTKTFTILSHTTNLGERVVRSILEAEVAAVQAPETIELSIANYAFMLASIEAWHGRQCYVLDMMPRRKEKGLLHGSIWVDASTFLLHRVMGQPAKSPSWWLRQPHIEFSYGPVEGMWLQTGSLSSANVRVFGPYTMTSRNREYHVGEITGSIADTIPGTFR